MSPSTLTKVTTDHDEIRRWAEERGAKPAAVIRTEHGDDPGIIRLDFPGYSGEGSLEEISWDEWFRKFDERNLAFLYQEYTANGEKSNFNKIVSRETAEELLSKHNRRGSSGDGGESHGRSGGERTAPQQRHGSSEKRTSGSRSKTASAGSSREKRSKNGEDDGRERTTRKSVSARGRGASSGRTSTRSRASEKRSTSSRSGGASRRTEARSSRTTSRSGGRQASARSSGSSSARSKRSSSQSSSRRTGSR